MITFHIITLFPESLESYLNASIVKRAQEDGYIALKYYNPRDFAIPGKRGGEMTYVERRVDSRPYGGGPGMIIEALPVIRAIDKAVGRKLKIQSASWRTKFKTSGMTASKQIERVKIIFFSPAGKEFTNALAETFKKYSDIVLVCGRYEGIDARVKKAFPMADISIGPYVLTGGELPAMIVIDAVTRRLSGVLGDELSIEENRIACPDVYTRPEMIEFKGKKLRVPKILLSGDHAKIDEWKKGRKK
ncbi:MAG: tRNA (guanosine(37)-N1)-methyltransferase TrmD [Candidatus Taylorbacteria bacterium]|nr:tRNA (guanosine(37)-N1)-methyltransferase TrmD [Candidatus Taylorbacteria bacterium]